MPSAFGPGFSEFTASRGEFYQAIGGHGDLPGTIQRNWIRGGQQVTQVRNAVKQYNSNRMTTLVTFVGSKWNWKGWNKINESYVPITAEVDAREYGQQIIHALSTFESMPNAIEVWNEPDLKKFDAEGISGSSHNSWATEFPFEEFHAWVYDEIKGFLAANNIQLWTPGLAHTGYAGLRFLTRLISAGSKFDAISIHAYGPDNYFWERYRIVDEFNDVCKRQGHKAIPMYVTEWSHSLSLNPEHDGHVRAAGYVSQILAMYQAGVAGQCHFFLRDGFWETEDDWTGGNGMFTLNGYPKPIIGTLILIREMIRAQQPRFTKRLNDKHLDVMAQCFEREDAVVILCARSLKISTNGPKAYTQDIAMEQTVYDEMRSKSRLPADITFSLPYEGLELAEHYVIDKTRNMLVDDAFLKVCKQSSGDDFLSLNAHPSVLPTKVDDEEVSLGRHPGQYILPMQSESVHALVFRKAPPVPLTDEEVDAHVDAHLSETDGADPDVN